MTTTIISLAELEQNTLGFSITPSDNAGGFLGGSLSGIGDLNGDGFDDFILGPPPRENPNQPTLVFGTFVSFGQEGLPTRSFRVNGNADEGLAISAYSVNGIGDFNGDGLGDFIVGAQYAASGNGQAYVVFGRTTNFGGALDVSALNGQNGFVVEGLAPGNGLGFAVSSAGDVNGDGLDDLIVSAPFVGSSTNQTGETYVIFGQQQAVQPVVNPADLNGNNGFAIAGVDANGRLGYSVSRGGDINGDGFDDLIIGTPFADVGNIANAGRVYVVFGQDNGFASRFDLGTLNGTNGFSVAGILNQGTLGLSVSGIGDFNADGFDDVIVSAPLSDQNQLQPGTAYVIFGQPEGFSAEFDLAALNGSNGFVIQGLDDGDALGRSVSGAGDINGDGFDDLVIGADGADVFVDIAEPPLTGTVSNAGEAYIIYGQVAALTPTIDLANLGDRGFELQGGGLVARSGIPTLIQGAGAAVSDAGDINNDGFDDLLIGAPNTNFNDPNNPGDDAPEGQAYVVFGQAASQPLSLKIQANGVQSSASGVAVQFDQGLNLGVLNLFSAPNATDQRTDLTVVGATTGAVRGSAVFNSQTSTLTFVKTGTPLAADTYTLTLASRVSGFVGANGAPLDRDTPGEDVERQFTIADAPRIVSLPDFSQGPGQNIDLPTGLPLELNNAEGVTSLQFDFTFNPNLLTVTGVNRGADLPASWQLNPMIDPAGRVSVTLSGEALTGTEAELISLQASVPQSATYGASQVLQLGAAQLNGGALSVQGDAAVQVVAIAGDVSGNQALTAFDAAMLLGVANAQNALTPGFRAFPLIDPALIGDVNRSGDLSTDAIAIARMVAGLPPI